MERAMIDKDIVSHLGPQIHDNILLNRTDSFNSPVGRPPPVRFPETLNLPELLLFVGLQHIWLNTVKNSQISSRLC